MHVGLFEHLMFAGSCMANPTQFALVYDAAETDWSLLMLMCTKANIDPNSADYDSRSVLHVAAATGNLRIIQGLLQVGANINIRDRCDPNLLPFEFKSTHFGSKSSIDGFDIQAVIRFPQPSVATSFEHHAASYEPAKQMKTYK
jgi:ankyrin repeat protein